MIILIISATKLELSLFFKNNNIIKVSDNFFKVILKNSFVLDILITGVGIPATIYFLQKALYKRKYDFIINTGICGCFSKKRKIGDTFIVEKEQFGDLGVKSDIGFKTVFEQNLCNKNQFPFNNGVLVASKAKKIAGLVNIPLVNGITVNQISNNISDIEIFQKKYQADIETMEGAAVFYTALLENIPFIEIRTCSNYIRPRKKACWNIDLAVNNLNKTINDLVLSKHIHSIYHLLCNKK